MVETSASLIKSHGGATAFAAQINRSAGSVRLWAHRGAIPRDAWPEIIQAFPDITLDRLMAIEAAASAPAEAEA